MGLHLRILNEVSLADLRWRVDRRTSYLSTSAMTLSCLGVHDVHQAGLLSVKVFELVQDTYRDMRKPLGIIVNDGMATHSACLDEYESVPRAPRTSLGIAWLFVEIGGFRAAGRPEDMSSGASLRWGLQAVAISVLTEKACPPPHRPKGEFSFRASTRRSKIQVDHFAKPHSNMSNTAKVMFPPLYAPR